MSKFDDYKFRPSQLPLLMKSGRSKTEPLGETAKALLHDIYIEKVFGRKKLIASKEMEKGTTRENESISLYRKVKQVFCQKNEQRLQNDYLIGTPDLILEDKVVDIKTSWDIWTFFAVDEKKAMDNYYYQLVAYMLLTGKKKAELAYCLIDNSDDAITDEVRRISYVTKVTDAILAQIQFNNRYDDIPASQRVKTFSFELDPNEEGKITRQLAECRKYLNLLL